MERLIKIRTPSVYRLTVNKNKQTTNERRGRMSYSWIVVVFLVFGLPLGQGGAGVLDNQPWAPPNAVGASAFRSQFNSATILSLGDYGNATFAPVVYATSRSSSPNNGDVTLTYLPDSQGNVIPDFSYAGYGGGGVILPVDLDAPTWYISPSNVSTLQSLVNSVASSPLNVSTAYRGIIQFQQGYYNLTGVTINVQFVSGILFRGVGSDASTGTVLLVGDAPFFVNGHAPSPIATYANITSPVPTGSRRLYLADTTGLAVGDLVHVCTWITSAWKASVDTNDTLASSFNVTRYVTAVTASYIEVDAPMYYQIFTGIVANSSADYTTRNLGWANMRVVRQVGNPNLGVFIDAHGGIIDLFMKNVVTEYVGTLFQGSGYLSRRFTFEDCVALFNPIVTGHDPDSRQMFRIYQLSELLIHRCSQVYGRAFFGIQDTLTGSGIVISHCTDLRTWRGYYIFGAWFPGQLVDHVYSEYGLSFGPTAYGSRTGVASLIWNSYASFEDGSPAVLDCTSPETSMQNLCVGTTSGDTLKWK